MIFNSLVLAAVTAFTKIDTLLKAFYADITSTGITLFSIGLLICALIVWRGSDESAQKGKKGVVICFAGAVLFLVADLFVTYIKTKMG